jgi:hypothetical protein
MVDMLTVTGYLPVALALVGLALIASGLRGLQRTPRPRSWPVWARTYLHVFRAVVVGVCFIGIAWGLWAHIGWLLAASVCIAVGEFLESSYYDLVLQWGARTGRFPGGDPFVRRSPQGAAIARVSVRGVH